MNYQYYISYNGPHFVIFALESCYFVKFWLDLSLLSTHFRFPMCPKQAYFLKIIFYSRLKQISLPVDLKKIATVFLKWENSAQLILSHVSRAQHVTIAYFPVPLLALVSYRARSKSNTPGP